jgi:hypothetical protein
VIVAEFRRHKGEVIRRLVLRHDPGANLALLEVRLARVGWVPLPGQGSPSITVFTVDGKAGVWAPQEAVTLTCAASNVLAAYGVEVVNRGTMLIEFS